MYLLLPFPQTSEADLQLDVDSGRSPKAGSEQVGLVIS
jgi:hypothetical protein